MSRAPPIEKWVFGVNENLCRLVYRLVHRALDELPSSAHARMHVPVRRLSRHELVIADDTRISCFANLFSAAYFFSFINVNFKVIAQRSAKWTHNVCYGSHASTPPCVVIFMRAIASKTFFPGAGVMVTITPLYEGIPVVSVSVPTT